jgi:hypothetical protein
MLDNLLVLVLFLAFFLYGLVSIIWPHKLRRFSLGWWKLVIPVNHQDLFVRALGTILFLFSLAILWGFLKGLVR